MWQIKITGTTLAIAALLTSVGAQASTRSATSLPQDRIVHQTMPEDATIIDDKSLDYCFEGDVFSRVGVLLDEDACDEAGALLLPDAGSVAGVGGVGGTSGILIGLLAGAAALAGIIVAAGNEDDTPDSPG